MLTSVVSVAQPEQAGFGAGICETAIWASGAATQPLRARLQTIMDKGRIGLVAPWTPGL